MKYSVYVVGFPEPIVMTGEDGRRFHERFSTGDLKAGRPEGISVAIGTIVIRPEYISAILVDSRADSLM